MRELKKEYRAILDGKELRFAAALQETFVEADRQFVFLVDESDCVMRERQQLESLQRQYLDFLPLPSVGKSALVVELKYNKTVDSAIQQIKNREYAEALQGYAGDILLVGINYGRASKRHSCVIEKIEVNGSGTEDEYDGNCTGTTGRCGEG